MAVSAAFAGSGKRAAAPGGLHVRRFGLDQDLEALEQSELLDGISGPLSPLDCDMFSCDLASPKRPSKARMKMDAINDMPTVGSGRMPRLGDDDSIKEDCDENEDGMAIIKGPWAEHEDMMLRALVGEYGAKRWSNIADKLPGRIGKQVRLAPGAKPCSALLCRSVLIPT
eukprot:scaffold20104_cov120-Isochrysis_galbana.AAC.8